VTFQFRITSEIINQFRPLAGVTGRVINPSQGLCIHKTDTHTHTQTQTSMPYAGIGTLDPSTQAANTHDLDRKDTRIIRFINRDTLILRSREFKQFTYRDAKLFCLFY
jgi:hypothetical protein